MGQTKQQQPAQQSQVVQDQGASNAAAQAAAPSSTPCGCTVCPCNALLAVEIERQKTQLAIVRDQLHRAKDAVKRQQLEDEKKLDDLREEIDRAHLSANSAQAPNLEALRAQLADQVNASIRRSPRSFKLSKPASKLWSKMST